MIIAATLQPGQLPCLIHGRRGDAPSLEKPAVCFPQSSGNHGLLEPVRLEQDAGPGAPLRTLSLTILPSRSIVLRAGRVLDHPADLLEGFPKHDAAKLSTPPIHLTLFGVLAQVERRESQRCLIPLVKAIWACVRYPAISLLQPGPDHFFT